MVLVYIFYLVIFMFWDSQTKVNFTVYVSGLILHRGNGGDCVHVPWPLPWCPWNASWKKKCLGALALSKTKHIGLICMCVAMKQIWLLTIYYSMIAHSQELQSSIPQPSKTSLTGSVVVLSPRPRGLHPPGVASQPSESNQRPGSIPSSSRCDSRIR